LAELQAGALVVDPDPFFGGRPDQFGHRHHAMPFRRSMHGMNSPRQVA
jgi:hypothetical protein